MFAIFQDTPQQPKAISRAVHASRRLRMATIRMLPCKDRQEVAGAGVASVTRGTIDHSVSAEVCSCRLLG